MLNLKETTLICPNNDLEGKTIIDIARELNIDTRVSTQDWGGKLGKEPEENLFNLKKTVLVVELFDPPAEEILKAGGHEVLILDHHHYQDNNRWKPESSVEQFCHMVGYPISKEIKAVAVNDTDFINGLFKMGMSYDEMKVVRQQERVVRGTAGLFCDALQYATEHKKSFKDLDFVLAPYKLHRVMSEAAQWPTEKAYNLARKEGQLFLPNCLIIYHDDQDAEKIQQIEYFGEKCYFQSFIEITQNRTLDHLFQMWCGSNESGCYWGAIPYHNNISEIDKLIDHVLSFTLIAGRPLQYYSTSFLFPFTTDSDNFEFSVVESKLEEYKQDTKVYFLPQVQQFLFQAGSNSMEKRSLIIDESNHALKIFLDEQSKPIMLNINGINLYSFPGHQNILEIAIVNKPKTEAWKGKPFWRELWNIQEQYENSNYLSLEQALTVNNLARILYPTYTEQLEEGKAPIRVEWKNGKEFKPKYLDNYKLADIFSPIVLGMIQDFVKNDIKTKIKFDSVWDDRMFVHSCLALAGPPPTTKAGEERYNVLFTRATFVDALGSGKDYCYDKDFTLELIEPLTYRRWYGIGGNLYGFSRFSAVYLGFGGYFANTISKHVENHYLLLSILSLYFRSTLLKFNNEVALIDYPHSDKDEKKIQYCLNKVQNIHWELTAFSNKYWFREVTSQDQGIEIFDLQKKALNLQNEYEKVQQKIDQLFNLLDSKFKSRLNMVGWWISAIGIIFTINSIVTGFCGFYVLQTAETANYWGTAINWVVLGISFIGFIASIALLVFALTKYRPSGKNKPERN